MALLALITAPGFFPKDTVGLFYASYLCAANVLFLLYIYYVHRHKRYRYAEVVQHIHAVNHNIRDWLHILKRRAHNGTLRKDDFYDDFRENTVKVLDQIADTFSHLCGKRCGVCVKELLPNRLVHVSYRDALSGQSRGVLDSTRAPHDITRDTPCNELYLPKAPRRYYLCNDVITAWDNNKYDSPTFDLFPESPNIGHFLSLRIPIHWPLHYRSCLVIPIRFTSCPMPPPPDSDDGREWNYWGFLCVDCTSRNVFDEEKATQIAAAFADVLYIYFSETFGIFNNRNGSTLHQ